MSYLGMKRVVPICLLSMALCLPPCVALDAPPGPNYARSPSIRALLHWDHFPLHLFFPASRLATRERRALVLAGFGEWARATHGVVCCQVVPTEEQADVTVAFTSHPPAVGSYQVRGLTTLTRTGTVLKKAAMEIAERDEDPAGFQATAAHEFGHALGIDGHSGDPDDIMFPMMSLPHSMVRNDEADPPIPTRAVTRRDVNTLQAAYPDLVFAPPKR